MDFLGRNIRNFFRERFWGLGPRKCTRYPLKLRGHKQHFLFTCSKKILQVFCSKFYQVQQNAAITFKIVLESGISILEFKYVGLKEKTSSLYCSAFTQWRRESSKEKKSKANHLDETMAPKKSWTRNLQQSLTRINQSKITKRLY